MGSLSNIIRQRYQLYVLIPSTQQSYEEIGIERLSKFPKAIQLVK